MRNTFLLAIVLMTVLTSCGQENTSTPGVEQNGFVTSTIPDTNETISNDNYRDSKQEYTDSEGNRLTIVNSLPKGGLKYTDPTGKEYTYAVFWTRIANETANPFEWTVNFPEDSCQLPSSPDRYFKLFIPFDTLTSDKESLFNYGLDLERHLDNHYRGQADFKKVISPNDFGSFYVIVLFNKGVEGTVRAGLSIKGPKMVYRVNDKEVELGDINLKQLKPKN